ncbi:transglycosylase SLT domain-containing protein [Streptomyces sp. NPDC044780]|uniref:transglycosylase SLT domain-containing protein n=1 Tax=unclassified Streptomyces TaxID=2593676 RepID=UPI0022A872F0|nr:transglycosylase SLT domain-containing protein [Streptomyces sp. S465]WAP55264.1 transglycosylase SLT domain-containing protein [Streptomyces sp. S465]
MPLPNIPGYHRLTKTHKYSAAGIAAAGAAAIAFAVVPGGDTGAQTTAQDLPNKPVALTSQKADSQAHHEVLVKQSAAAEKQAKEEAAAKKKAAEEAAKKKAAEEAAAKKKAAEAKAAKERAVKQAASRSTTRVETVAAAKDTKNYPDNLDGWIRESLDIMKEKGIPGTYEGIHRNIIRESGGNPRAINLWDINAQNGVPSKGLLQVIAPTFKQYHVEGTSWDPYDPVANITAACNYAAARYGSMDNVNGPY